MSVNNLLSSGVKMVYQLLDLPLLQSPFQGPVTDPTSHQWNLWKEEQRKE